METGETINSQFKKEKVRITKKDLLFFIALSIVLIVSFILYLMISYVLLPQKEKEVLALESYTEEIKRSAIEEKKAEVSLAQNYINDFNLIWKNSYKSSEVFKFFESWAHPQIIYSNFKLTPDESKFTIAGKTSSNRNLMEQITIMKQQKDITTYNLYGVKISSTGEVTFNMDIYFTKSLIQR